jgi:uncharacterized protein
MEMTGEQLIPLSQQDTWNALNDPQILKDCIPGCESMERASDNQYDVVLVAKVGPVSARFKGKMTITESDPPRAYTLVFEGQGGAAGFAKGAANVELTSQDTATVLSYSAKATIGGKLAQVGSRLVDGVAKKLAGEFFASFNERVSAKS